MNNSDVQQRHLVVSNLEEDGGARIVGSANKKMNESHYVLYLRFLPGIPFYVVPHRERSGEFMVFSGRSKKDDGKYRFFCKIGSAIQLFNQSVIEIHLPDLRQVYYLKLEINDLHYTEKQSAA